MGKIPVFSAVMEIPTLKTGIISKSIRSCVNILSIENHNPNGKDNGGSRNTQKRNLLASTLYTTIDIEHKAKLAHYLSFML
jgi:hypothetical protein